MSVGSWAVSIDSYNRSSRNWTGRNGRENENPYSGEHMVMKSQVCTNTNLLYPFNVSYGYNKVPYSASYDLPLETNEVLKAQAALADAVRGHSFNASVTIGEASQTADLIANTAKKVLTSARQLRRGNWQDATRTLLGSGGKPHKGRPKSLNQTDLANFWIELQYGWLPLLSEIEEAQKALLALRQKQSVIYRVRASTRTPFLSNPQLDQGMRTVTVGIKAKFYDVLTAAQSTGIHNPLNVLWELTPWSFVVDWFVPIGTWLDNLSLLGTLDKSVSTTVFRKTEFRYEVKTFLTGTYNTISVAGGKYAYQKVNLQRSGYVLNPPLVGPSMKTMRKALSLGHLQNAAALIQQQIGATRKAFR